ncbi:hypothetical protein UPYG_G00157090 [Umbra pygmaea]|uniref:Uncharacterized protein n=1 Tax=Umbra pygmaea TaxID=75934 RepID=A0ABD0XN93_UMBPY
MASSQKGRHTPANFKDHHHFSYGGAITPENVIIQQFYDLTPTKKSNVRLNDQLIPKPADINIAETTIKVPIPKEHPYQAHISRFALFPTFRSPDDPNTGVRAASQPQLNPLVPASAPQVTMLRKTKGSPYRHEALEAPMATRKKAITWPGQHGFLDHPKPVKGAAQRQMFYPTPQKTVFPNPSLRDWEVTLSERTANMLRNIEMSQWVTSYQLQFTGTGPSNALKQDDFHKKTTDVITGDITPYTAKLRERSYPILVSPKPRDGRKARIHQGRRTLESTYTPPPVNPPAESLIQALTSSQDSYGPVGNLSGHPGPQEKDFTKDYHRNSSNNHIEPSLGGPRIVDMSGLGPESSLAAEHVTKEKIQRELGYLDIPSTQGNRYRASGAGRELAPDTKKTTRTSEHETDWCLAPNAQDIPSSRNLALSSEVTDNQMIVTLHLESQERASRDVPHSISHPCLQPLLPVMPPTHPGQQGIGGGGCNPPGRRQSSLMELQDSFSKSEVHQRFHSSIQGGTVNLQENVHAGRKHRFYGFHSYYFHN